MQKEAYFTEGKILGNIAYYCLQYQEHLGNLQHAGWFKIIHTVNGYARTCKMILLNIICAYLFSDARTLILTVSIKILMSNLMCEIIIANENCNLNTITQLCTIYRKPCIVEY